MRPNRVKRALKEGKPQVGTWLSLGSLCAARFLARSGFDWLNIDIEHSMVGMETTTAMMAAIADAGCPVLARVPSNRHDHIKRVLDNGAHGVVVPMVNSRAEAEAAVSACLYPPAGTRSVGGNQHALNFDTTAAEYYVRANDEILIVLQCEHIDAVHRADEIFSVPGIDAIFVGPNDLAASMRSRDGRSPSPEATREAMQHILATCRKHGVAAGVHTFSAQEARLRMDEGWQFIAINSDLKMLLDGATAILRELGGDRLRSELARY
ncbi:MAG: aldolase/citrate lyase family protein [Gemmataceae bacterium]|nr:aldolase/citrate lyase family protein [Gemmataceae bacterium]